MMGPIELLTNTAAYVSARWRSASDPETILDSLSLVQADIIIIQDGDADTASTGAVTTSAASPASVANGNGVISIPLTADDLDFEGLATVIVKPAAAVAQSFRINVVPELSTSRLAKLSGMIIDAGTLQSATSTTARLAAGNSFLNNVLNDRAIIVITGGAGVGGVRTITEFASSTEIVTIDEPWSTIPNSTSTYVVLPVPKMAAPADKSLLQSTTIATLASQTSFTLTGGSADDDAYNGAIAVFTDQSTPTQKAYKTISDYVGSSRTVTLAEAPEFTITTGDTIDIIVAATGGESGGSGGSTTIASGTLQSATSTTAVLAASTSFVDDLLNNRALLVITAGTGVGQSRLITDWVSSTDTATVDSAWTVTPDDTSEYVVLPVQSLRAISDKITAQSIVLTGGNNPNVDGVIAVISEDDYNNADGVAFEFESDGWPDLTDATVTFRAKKNGRSTQTSGFLNTGSASGTKDYVEVTATKIDEGESTQIVRVELTSSDTDLEAGNYFMHIRAVLASGRKRTLLRAPTGMDVLPIVEDED